VNYAVKTITISSKKDKDEKMKEIELNKIIKDNDFLVKMKEFFVEETYDPETEITTYKIRMVMPLGKSLRTLMIEKIEKGQTFSEEELFSMID
jgi:hypothetical protein